MRLVFGIILSLCIMFSAFADEKLLSPHKLTGTVVSADSRYNSAAIVNDKIWWEGQTYFVQDGQIQYPVSVGGRVKVDELDLATLVKVENSKVTVEYRGQIFVYEAR